MKYNPLIHHRKSIRLKGYDYSKAGAYFITICCEDRRHRFGKILAHKMILNQLGTIAYNEWINLMERFSSFELDVFQIMPNHMHGIIVLKDINLDKTVGATLAVAQDENEVNSANRATARVAPTTIADVVGAYKSIVSNECLKLYKLQNKQMGKLWQRNYYEHIIRDENAYINISNYIINNPNKWDEDKFHI
ncbi:hypothetical protein EZJ43_15355 [Pedobacter changchengzhani]|uniref:Transposase IS200-like domain-containing protein n=1 Tax=Pedobacter changchengzhani TaxID=2529274 RepID=A0A4R5MHX4_9SPHI|nr:transposase [Pedobacter changchengzhani]TDG35101.1 hypothetical protein EZJ43_15355 [Pedobacter changchengzhani]